MGVVIEEEKPRGDGHNLSDDEYKNTVGEQAQSEKEQIVHQEEEKENTKTVNTEDDVSKSETIASVSDSVAVAVSDNASTKGKETEHDGMDGADKSHQDTKSKVDDKSHGN